MRGLLRFADVIDVLNKYLRYWGFLIVILMLIVILNLISTNIFNSPFLWAWVVNQDVLGALVVMGGGTAFLYQDFIRVDIFYSKFSRKTQLKIDVIGVFLPLLFVGVLVWFGIESFQQSIVTNEHTTGIFRTPRYPIKLIFVIGVTMLLLQVVVQFIRNILNLMFPDRHDIKSKVTEATL